MRAPAVIEVNVYAEAAQRVRALMKKRHEADAEIAAILRKALDELGKPHWLAWCEREFGWKRHAASLRMNPARLEKKRKYDRETTRLREPKHTPITVEGEAMQIAVEDGRKSPALPAEGTKRREIMAEANKDRLEKSVTALQATVNAVEGIELELALSVSTAAERNDWTARLSSVISNINLLKRKIT